ncbi:hypothetical protein RFI_38498 [Reticulomyxa filosa]|uniref:Uncharacterized protein n=1 Tax=Reticulomyxa filosa TaxID=46433 RepID=X6LCZ7_RETFI|nr:hypothetical protein RFI_38498 [Reticulomyxa filosa]|eukprot:ETN98991.1 hypothetical protein RFI_38498 [Reticulomyxa filosa]
MYILTYFDMFIKQKKKIYCNNNNKLKKLKNKAAKWRKETSDAAENVIKSRQKLDGTNGKKNKVSQDVDYVKTRNLGKQFQAAVNKYNMELKNTVFQNKKRYNEEYEGWKQDVINTKHLQIESMITLFNKLLAKQKQSKMTKS